MTQVNAQFMQRMNCVQNINRYQPKSLDSVATTPDVLNPLTSTQYLRKNGS